MKKLYLFLLLIFINSSVFSQSVQVTERLANKMSTLNPLQYTRVLILMKDRVDIEQLDKDLYEMNATMGYIASDLTGNRIVDLTDLLLVFNNASNFVVRKSPPGSSPVSVVYDSRSLYEQRMKVINENRVQEDEFPGVRKDEGYKNQEKILKNK